MYHRRVRLSIDRIQCGHYTAPDTVTDALDVRASRPALAEGVPDDALEEINRLWTIVSAFSSTAHDVNNALQVVSGSAELLEALDLDPTVRRRVEAIREEAAKAAGAIHRLLTYARSEALPIQPLDVWPIVEASVEMRVASAGRRRIGITVDRQGSTTCLALVDRARFQQALIDLLLSAEAHVRGRRNARVVVRVGHDDGMATVCLTASFDADAGGLPDEQPSPPARALTSGAQVWAAGHLAAAQRGHVGLVSSVSELTLTLSVPAG